MSYQRVPPDEPYPPPGYSQSRPYPYPPPQGYQGPYPPPHHPPPPPGYQGYFNPGQQPYYPPPPPPPPYGRPDHCDHHCGNEDSGAGFLKGCLAALCCCCLLEECCF